MKDFNIYLIGGMGKFGADHYEDGNNWRVYLKHELESVAAQYRVFVINPNDYYNFRVKDYDSEREIMEFDLNKVRHSDLCIVNFNDIYSLGSMAELAIAYERRIPVIGLTTTADTEKLHPWQREMTTKLFTDIDKLVDYVSEFYLY